MSNVTCTYEQEIQTEGVHVLDSGTVKLYSDDDCFHCPKCDGDPDEPAGEYDDLDSSITDSTTGEIAL
jgi:hypothetical protein